MRVLVVEDEQDLAEAIATGLRREGYAVDLAHAGDEALVKARVYPYDLICLDLSLPGTGGREVCRTLRAEVRADGAPQPRILMLTARGGVDDRIAGLDDGADDYLVKPFELGELAARARALLRRNGDRGRAPLRVGSLELDAARHEATQNGTPLALTPKEFALLRYLMSRPGEALSEFELLTHVWDENANPLTRTVRVTVMTLRRKLDGNPIETVPGAGYRLQGRRMKGFLALDPGPADAALLGRPLRRRRTARRRPLHRPLAQPPRPAAVPGRGDSRHRADQRREPDRGADLRRRAGLRAAGEPAHAPQSAQLLARRARGALRREPRGRLGDRRQGAGADRSHHAGGARDPGGGAVAPDRARRAGRRAEAARGHVRLDAGTTGRRLRRRSAASSPTRRTS